MNSKKRKFSNTRSNNYKKCFKGRKYKLFKMSLLTKWLEQNKTPNPHSAIKFFISNYETLVKLQDLD